MFLLFTLRNRGKQCIMKCKAFQRGSFLRSCMEKEQIRLNKYLSQMGICSRREADRLISEGKISVGGVPAEAGMKVDGSLPIICDGRLINAPEKKKDKPVLLVVNKPRGIVCTTTDKDRAPDIVSFLHYPFRIYPVGRLDKESEGLILMTNQGDLVNKIMRAGNAHEKEYEVQVNKPITREFLAGMASGVPLKELDTVTRPCTIEATGKNTFTIILTQGLNRQIRRMCQYFGYQVLSLKRVRIMNIRLGNLKTGDFRNVTKAEWEQLQKLLTDSTNLPAAERT